MHAIRERNFNEMNYFDNFTGYYGLNKLTNLLVRPYSCDTYWAAKGYKGETVGVGGLHRIWPFTSDMVIRTHKSVVASIRKVVKTGKPVCP